MFVTSGDKVVLQSIYKLYATAFARPGFRRMNQFLVHLGLRGLGVFNYTSEYLSGERDVTRAILRRIDTPDQCLVDVGANVGRFSHDVLTHSSSLNVVSFEPHPETARRLAERLSPHAGRVTIINKAVGSTAGEITLYDRAGDDGTSHASAVPGVFEHIHRQPAVAHVVPVTTLDDMTFPGRVAFLKIDVEGLEMDVVRGAAGLLARDRTDFVLMEFNEMNVISGNFLHGFITALPDYDVYRILPGGRLLALNRPYLAFNHEVFGYQNILFVRHGSALPETAG